MAEHRSPNYPRKSLPDSIRDAQQLYAKERTGTFAGLVAAKAFGYPKLHGKARLRLASLRQYGLLDVDKKAGTSRLSQRALAILLRPDRHPERQAALEAAALEPAMFQEFWQHQPTASDDSLHYELITKRGFSETGAAAFLKAYRDTMQVLSESPKTTLTNGAIHDTVGDQQAEIIPEQEGLSMSAPIASSVTPADIRVLNLPLSPTTWARLEAPFPMDAESWENMMSVLNAMKPVLIGHGQADDVGTPASG